MLARSFMSATELRISEAEYAALIKTLFAFERNEIQPEQFDMREWCGTAACICGHAQHFSPDVFNGQMFSWPYGLRALFAPPDSELPEKIAYEDIKPKDAAVAISNYLTTGEPHWNEVLS